MAIRDKIATNVQPQLEPGETLQAGFPAQSGMSPWLLPITGYLAAFFLCKYVIIVVTDKRIAVFKASPLATTKPKELFATFPRDTTLGPVSGIWGKLDLGGTRYYVHKRFHKDVEQSNAGSAAAAPATT
jgi:hypothetical protein